MSDHSKIEWTATRDADGNVVSKGATWNPVRGCSRVSSGCKHCYAERHAARFSGAGLPFEGFAVTGSDGPHWTGKVELVRDKLTEPLKWKRPRRIFVNSMSDLFHEDLHRDSILRVFLVMAQCPQHTFQILTKRPERMRMLVSEWLPSAMQLASGPALRRPAWPLPNVWLGVSVEDQATADARIPLLLQTPAAVRFVSAEPLLGPVDLNLVCYDCDALSSIHLADEVHASDVGEGLHWVIVGGESGPGARPMHPTWARDIRDACAGAEVAFFFKQWGAWAPLADPIDDDCMHPTMKLDRVTMCRYGKHAAGRLLDGREHNDMPTAPTPVLA